MSATTAESLPTTGLWSIDSAHSTANFSVRHHAIATFRNGFTGITGSYDGEAGKLVGEVRVDGITLAGLDRLKRHILTPDFFDAEQHPTFGFESTSLRPDGDGLVLEGNLTIRGVTRRVTATGSARGPLTVRHGDGRISERLGIDLSTTIDRRDYGVLFNSEVAEGILNLGWDVTLDVALEFSEDA